MSNILNQLRERYAAPQYAIFFEVANGTGVHTSRYADAIAMSLFPSRGLDIYGFEVKTDRGDWLKELKTPKKAEAIAAYCDFWFVVTGDEKVALKAEVPRNWGLLVSRDGILKQVKGAERLDPTPIDRKFLGALLRRADEWIKHELENDERLKRERQIGFEQGKVDQAWDSKRAVADFNELKRALAEFETKSGISINQWDHGDIGAAVKSFLWAQKYDSVEELEMTANFIEAKAKTIRERAEILKAARSEKKDVELREGESV